MKLLLVSLLLFFSFVNAKLHSVKGPIKAIYIDWENINWNAPEQALLGASNAGFNVIIIAFYLSSGVTDYAQAWQGVPSSTKQTIMDTIHSRGQIALVSLGGSTDNPYSYDPNQLGATVANWALRNLLDGVDFDLENFSGGGSFTAQGMNSEQTVEWIVAISNAARQVLGPDRYVTHAPEAEYFGAVGDQNMWPGVTGGYTGVYNKANNIDWFNMQFYNQGSDCYTSYDGLFVNSCDTFPGTSVTEITKYGIPLNKIVVGKPVQTSEASNGYVDPNTLHNWFVKANGDFSWNTGVMGWEWAQDDILKKWISSIYPSSSNNNTVAY